MAAQYEFKTENQTVTAVIIGKIDSSNAGEFETELFKGIGDFKNVILDLEIKLKLLTFISNNAQKTGM